MLMNIFIVGTPRSGTTLVQDLVLKSIDACSGPETHFFDRAYTRRLYKKHFFNKALVLNDVAAKLGVDRQYGFVFGPNNASKKFMDMIEFVKKTRGKKMFIEKTPIHLRYINEIERVSHDAIFFHVLREPYETVRSLYFAYKRYPMYWGREKSVESILRRYIRDMREHALRLGVDSSYFIKYEDVVRDPVGAIEGLVEMIGCEVVESGGGGENIVESFEGWKKNNLRGEVVEKISNDYGDFLSKNAFYRKYHAASRIRDLLAESGPGCEKLCLL